MSCLERALLELPEGGRSGKLVPALLLAGAERDAQLPPTARRRCTLPPTSRTRRLGQAPDCRRRRRQRRRPERQHAAALWRAAVETVRALLDAGANIHASNNMFNTPLHVARALHGEDVSRALVEKGADGAMANENKNQARELLRVGAPPGGIYFSQPKAPLVLPSDCGGVFIPRLNEQS
jgi:hypothetical protein